MVNFINAQAPTFYVGNAYIKLNESARMGYVAGLYDMWTYLTYNHSLDIYRPIFPEMKGMTLSQVITDTYCHLI